MTVISRRAMVRVCAAIPTLTMEMPFAQEIAFPTKPLRVIVPVPPGGPADALVRVLAKQMEGKLHQPVIVDNRPGAVGLLALQAAAASPPDGHTIVQIHPGMISGQLLMKRFDILQQLSPITVAAEFPIALIVPGSSPIRSFDEFKRKGLQQAGELTYGTLGVGSYEHLLIESLCNAIGVKAAHVPYKGGAELVQALIGKQIEFAYVLTQLALPYVQKDQLRALAVLSAQREKGYPNTPTLAELNVAVKSRSYWLGLCALAGTPAAVTDRLYRALVEAVNDPVSRDWFEKGGSVSTVSPSPAHFRRLIEDDQRFLQDVISTNKIVLS